MMAAGAWGYMTKPLDLASFQRQLDRALAATADRDG